MSRTSECPPPYDNAKNDRSATVDLTPREQEAVDCVACFTVNGREIESADIIACRGQNPNSLRPLLAGLVAKEVLRVVSPEGVRRKRYEPTSAGMQSASKDLNPWDCPMATSEKELPGVTEIQQKAIDCASCVKNKGHEITVSKIINGCGGIHETLDYSMRSLVKKGYLTQSERVQGRPVVYDLTDAGGEKVSSVTNEACSLTDATMPLNEKNVLDCIKCQVAKGLTPESRRAQDCTGLSRRALLGAVNTLIEQGLIRQDDEFEKVGLRTTGRQRPLRLNDLSTSGHNPKCSVEDNDAARVFDRLSDDKKRMLGCIACVAGGRSMLPGATTKVIAECAGLSRRSVEDFVGRFIEEEYVNELKGYAMDKHSVRFLALSDKGDQLVKQGRDDPLLNHECATDFSQYDTAPVHITNNVIRCVGCIWTQQAAAGQKPQATISVIQECIGADRSHLTEHVMPKLVESGYFTASGKSPVRFHPSNKMIIPLGYSATCKQDIFKTDYNDFFEVLPSDVFEPQDEDDSLRKFEEFVDGLKSDDSAGPSSDLYSGLYLQRNQRPRLTAEEEAFLSMIIQKSPDQRLVDTAHHRFLASNIRMAGWMAGCRKFEVAVTSFDDMIQAAMMGVDRAAKTFDPLYGFKFSTYAHSWMLHYIQGEAAKITGIKTRIFTKIPRTLSAIHQLRSATKRSPTIPEIAVLTGYKVDEVRQVIDAYAGLRLRPLDDNKGGAAQSGYDRIGVESSGIENATYDDFFRRARGFLDERERDVLENLILSETMPLWQFADSRGMKHQEVKECRAAVLAKLQHPYFGFGCMLSPKLFGWQQDAECFLGEDSRVLTQNRDTLTRDVREMCDGCEANTQCHAFAERRKPFGGIWAGQGVS